MVRLLFSAILATTFSIYQQVEACNVPVFRYALERWQSDEYELVILHNQDLTPSEKTKIESIAKRTRTRNGSLNLRVRVYDLRTELEPKLNQFWSSYASSNQSTAALLLYSANAREVPDRIVSITPFSKIDADSLVDSPARKLLEERILSGDSAVWIFVTSGNQEKDEEAYKRLEDQIAWNKANLALPNQDVLEADEFFDKENPIELRLDFSIVKVNRNDPREQFFVDMLMQSESDLEELDQPMAFPVIGRGRVLYALVGKGIYKETIEMASKFVVGPCSCQVKDQNPGFDLLMNTDWDSQVTGKEIAKPLQKNKKAPILIQIPTGK